MADPVYHDPMYRANRRHLSGRPALPRCRIRPATSADHVLAVADGGHDRDNMVAAACLLLPARPRVGHRRRADREGRAPPRFTPRPLVVFAQPVREHPAPVRIPPGRRPLITPASPRCFELWEALWPMARVALHGETGYRNGCRCWQCRRAHRLGPSPTCAQAGCDRPRQFRRQCCRMFASHRTAGHRAAIGDMSRGANGVQSTSRRWIRPSPCSLNGLKRSPPAVGWIHADVHAAQWSGVQMPATSSCGTAPLPEQFLGRGLLVDR